MGSAAGGCRQRDLQRHGRARLSHHARQSHRPGPVGGGDPGQSRDDARSTCGIGIWPEACIVSDHPVKQPLIFAGLLIASLLSSSVIAPTLRAADAAKKGARPKLTEPSPSADTSRVAATRPFDKVVVFKKTPQGELNAHIYFPPGWSAADHRPAIVFWVGGGFRSGRVGQFTARADYFASRGLVTICAEYRGRDSHGILIDSCAEDARSAMRWVKGRAKELGVAPDKIIASGGSAGGCLSLLVAREKGPDAKDDNLALSTRPAALMLFNPAVGDRVMGIVGRGGPAQELVNAQIAALDTPQKDEPPAIMFFGTEDAFLKVAREFNRKAQAQGSRCDLWVADKQAHGFFNSQPWHDATTRLADDFLVSLGYVKGASPIRQNPAAMLTLEGER
jgi:acetyl esterase